MSGPTINRGGSSGDIWTPQMFIDAVVETFGPLSVDLAAEAHSTKCKEFIDPQTDSLKQGTIVAAEVISSAFDSSPSTDYGSSDSSSFGGGGDFDGGGSGGSW